MCFAGSREAAFVGQQGLAVFSLRFLSVLSFSREACLLLAPIFEDSGVVPLQPYLELLVQGRSIFEPEVRVLFVS